MATKKKTNGVLIEGDTSIMYFELGQLLCEYVNAMGEAKQYKEAIVDYLMEHDAFDTLAEIVSDLALMLKNP